MALLAEYTAGPGDLNVGVVIPKRAEVVSNASSAWFNKSINKISFQIQKFGLPTGTFYVRVWDSSSVVKLDLGSGLIQDLTDAYVWHDFTSPSSYTLAVGDRIGVEYSGGVWASDVLRIKGIITNDAYDPPNTTQSCFVSPSWIVQQDHDLNFKLYGAGPSGTKLPPSPITVRF